MSDEKDLPIPLRDNVLLRSEKDVKTAGGIAIPDSAVQNYAVVIAVGPGTYEAGAFVPTTVKPGQRVLLDAPQGAVGTFRWNSVKYQMTSERFIGAILPGETPLGDAFESKLVLPTGMSIQ